MKNKSEENVIIIKKFLVGLAREIMQALDVRKDGSLDVRQVKDYVISGVNSKDTSKLLMLRVKE